MENAHSPFSCGFCFGFLHSAPLLYSRILKILAAVAEKPREFPLIIYLKLVSARESRAGWR